MLRRGRKVAVRCGGSLLGPFILNMVVHPEKLMRNPHRHARRIVLIEIAGPEAGPMTSHQRRSHAVRIDQLCYRLVRFTAEIRLL